MRVVGLSLHSPLFAEWECWQAGCGWKLPGEVHSSEYWGSEVERGTSYSNENRIGLLGGRLLGPACMRVVAETLWCLGEAMISRDSTYVTALTASFTSA